MEQEEQEATTPVEYITTWIGSVSSLVIHTLVFVAFFLLSFVGILSWSLMLLILTTVVSLEAIYLAIFIQMTVNRQAIELAEVSEDVEDIQEDLEELGEDVDEIQEDLEEDEREEVLEAERKRRQADTLEMLTKNIERMLEELETLKKGNK